MGPPGTQLLYWLFSLLSYSFLAREVCLVIVEIIHTNSVAKKVVTLVCDSPREIREAHTSFYFMKLTLGAAGVRVQMLNEHQTQFAFPSFLLPTDTLHCQDKLLTS